MLLTTRQSEFLSRIAAKVIYGTIIHGAVLGSISDPLPGNLRVIVTVFLSLHLVSVAGAFAQSIDHDMATRTITGWADKGRMLLTPGWTAASTVVPITFFGLALAGLISQESAAAATRYGLVAVLVFFGFVSRRLSGGGMLSSLVTGLSAALLGYVVVQLKLWTKYLPAFGFQAL
jgi:hypothetical protein